MEEMPQQTQPVASPDVESSGLTPEQAQRLSQVREAIKQKQSAIPVLGTIGSHVEHKEVEEGEEDLSGLSPEERDRLEKVRNTIAQRKYGGLGGAALAAGVGFLSTPTFSGSDQVISALGGQQLLKDLERSQKEIRTLGEVGGLFVPVFGQLGAAGKAVSKLGVGLEGLTKVAGKAGELAAKGLGEGVAKGAVKGAVSLGLEGGVFGLQQAIKDDALGDHDLISAKTISNIGMSAILGGALGAAAGGIAGKIGKSATKAEDILAKSESQIVRDIRLSDKAENLLVNDLDKAVYETLPKENKIGFLEGYTQVKKDAPKIVEAANALGVEALPMQLAENKTIQDIYDRSMKQINSAGVGLRAKVTENIQKVSSKVEDIFKREAQIADEEAGELFVNAIDESLSKKQAPIKAIYDAREAAGETIALEAKEQAAFMKKLSSSEVRVGEREGDASKKWAKLLERFGKQRDVRDLDLFGQALNSEARVEFTRGQTDMGELIANFKKEVDEFAADAIVLHAKDRASSMIAAAKNQGLEAKVIAEKAMRDAESINALHRENKQNYGRVKKLVSQVADDLGIKAGKNPTVASLVKALKKEAKEQVISKMFDPKNAAALARLEENFPEAFNILKQAKKSQIYRSLQKDNVFQLGTLYKNVLDENKMSKGVLKKLFTAEEIELMNKSLTYVKSFPGPVNLSKTSDAIEIDNFLKDFMEPVAAGIAGGPLAAAAMVAKGMLSKSQIPLLDAAIMSGTEIQGLLKKTELSTTEKIVKKAKAILNSDLPRSVSAKIISTVVSKSDYEKKSDQVRRFSKDPNYAMEKLDKMTEGIAEYAPNVAEAMKQQTIAAMDFLSSKLPITDATDDVFFERKLEPSANEIQRFNRYYSIVERPTDVLNAIEEGTLTSEHIETLNAVYPKLYEDMQQTIMTEIANKKDKSSVPYRTRMMLSLFMGQSFDSSLKEWSVMSYQGHFLGTNGEINPVQSARQDLKIANRYTLQAEDDDV